MKATKIREIDEGYKGTAWLYRLDPPIQYERWEFNDEGDSVETARSAEYVISSAVVVDFSGPETYLFAANEDGQITEWCELSGSFRGELDCDKAIRNAGYEIEEE